MKAKATPASVALESLKKKARYNAGARDSYARVKSFLAAHERKSGDGEDIGGTGATEFRLLQFGRSPISRLYESGNLGNEEMQAVEDISTAFHSLAGGLLIKPQQMERQDKSHNENDPARIVSAQKRYQAWARIWSARKPRGCKLLEIVIAAVIDERALNLIERELEIGHGKAKKALIAGLRDYAARAGWADSGLSSKWIATAERVFTLRVVE